jgi:hypothetical protein
MIVDDRKRQPQGMIASNIAKIAAASYWATEDGCNPSLHPSFKRNFSRFSIELSALPNMKITTTDTHLAAIYYDVLLEHARTKPGKSIRYKEVLENARRLHPNDDTVAAAIPISIGRRLELIVEFVLQNQLPPLTCIAVNESGLPGPSYKVVNGSWQADMDAVAAHDWAKWKDKWDTYMRDAVKEAIKLKRRKEVDARQMVYDEYRAERVPQLSSAEKEQLVVLLMDGLSVEDAMQEI